MTDLPQPPEEAPKKLIIDEQLAYGLGKQLLSAMAQYFKVELTQITISNDGSSPEHTLVFLRQVKRSSPKIKLRLQELQRHQRTEVYYKGEGDICDIELRIEDGIIVDIARKILE